MKQAIRFGSYVVAFSLLTALACGSAWARPAATTSAPQSVNAPEDSFLASDDYKDKGNIKNVFLKDPEYAKMMEDFKRNGSDEFDWGWAAPDLNLKQYKTIRVVVKDDFGVLNPDFNKYVEKMFKAVAQRLHLKLVGDKSAADVELGVDIVGYDPNSHYAFVTVVQPNVTLEIRLRDLKAGKDLLLIRNTEHGVTPKAATSETARDLMQALR